MCVCVCVYLARKFHGTPVKSELKTELFEKEQLQDFTLLLNSYDRCRTYIKLAM